MTGSLQPGSKHHADARTRHARTMNPSTVLQSTQHDYWYQIAYQIAVWHGQAKNKNDSINGREAQGGPGGPRKGGGRGLGDGFGKHVKTGLEVFGISLSLKNWKVTVTTKMHADFISLHSLLHKASTCRPATDCLRMRKIIEQFSRKVSY